MMRFGYEMRKEKAAHPARDHRRDARGHSRVYLHGGARRRDQQQHDASVGDCLLVGDRINQQLCRPPSAIVDGSDLHGRCGLSAHSLSIATAAIAAAALTAAAVAAAPIAFTALMREWRQWCAVQLDLLRRVQQLRRLRSEHLRQLSLGARCGHR